MDSFSPQTSLESGVSTAVASDKPDTPFDEFDRSQLFSPSDLISIIDRILKNQWILFQCTSKYPSEYPTPVLIYDTMMDISAKLTLESPTGRQLRDCLITLYQLDESYQATNEGYFTRVTLMLQQYVLVNLNLLGFEGKGVLQRIMPAFDQTQTICGYQVELIFDDYMTRVSEALPIATISDNLQPIDGDKIGLPC